MPGDECRPAIVERLDEGVARGRHAHGLAACDDAVLALAGARQPDAAAEDFELAAMTAERHDGAGRQAAGRLADERGQMTQLLRIHH